MGLDFNVCTAMFDPDLVDHSTPLDSLFLSENKDCENGMYSGL